MSQSAEGCETIFEISEDAILVYDVIEADGEFEFELRRLNPAHEAASGLSSDECRGASPKEMLDESQGATATANLRQCAERQETITYEEVLELPSGTSRWRTKLSPVVEDGTAVQIVGIARDITGKKERKAALRRTKERLDLALEATDTGVWEWNMETDEVVWNDALERLVGIEQGSFDGHFEEFVEYLHPDAVPKVERAVSAAIEGDGTFEAEFRMVRADGETIWVLGRGELHTETGTRRMIGTTTDITERKANELALARREILDLSVQLEFHSEEIAERLLDHLDGSMHLSVDGVVPGPDGSEILYVTVRGVTPKAAQATIDAMQIASEGHLLSTHGETSRYEVRVGSASAASVFDQFGGVLQLISIEAGTCKLVGEFPETVDPVSLTEAVRETYADVELASRRQIVSPTYLRSLMTEKLTERQQTVLGMAYHAGYFEQPRAVTGEDLASRLGITRQTFNAHLRKAQATLFEALFEGQIELPD